MKGWQRNKWWRKFSVEEHKLWMEIKTNYLHLRTRKWNVHKFGRKRKWSGLKTFYIREVHVLIMDVDIQENVFTHANCWRSVEKMQDARCGKVCCKKWCIPLRFMPVKLLPFPLSQLTERNLFFSVKVIHSMSGISFTYMITKSNIPKSLVNVKITAV